MNKQRCFIAIKVEPVRAYFDYLSSIKSNYDVKIKVVDPNNYHFTLHFFGDLSEIQISKVIDSFNSIEMNAFEFTLSKTGSLPRNKLPNTRVLFVSPDKGKNEIEEIAKKIQDTIVQDGFEIPSRKFTPHLTVSRIRSGSQIGELTSHWLNTDFTPVTIKCEEIMFMKSDLTSSGPRYYPLFEYKLNKG